VTPTPPSQPGSDRAPIVVFAGVLLLTLALLAGGWHASILDRYEFRQLQTALSTWWIAHEGWQLDYLTPLFGPPWSVPMEFPTYQVIVAWLHGFTGLPLESTGRLVSVLAFLACLPAIYDLLGLANLRPSRRLLALTAVLTAPVYLFYARTVMIETTALAFSVWFLALLRRALEQPGAAWIAGATIAGALAALTKVTTFLVFGPPALALLVVALRRPGASRIRLALVALATGVLPLGLAWWWFQHGDAVKDSNPFTGFLTARELRDWNFGPLALRFDASFWLQLLANLTRHNLAEGALAASLLCAPFAGTRARWIAGAVAAGFLSGPLVFANLYHIHDYYYAANALLLLAAAGLLVAAAWDHPHLPRGTNWLALGLLLASQLHAYYRGYYAHIANPAPPPPAIAAAIREAVPAGDVVLVYGADWNPLLPYYFERRAVMVPGERERETEVLDQVLARLPPRRIAAMVVHGDKVRAQTDFIHERAARFGLSPQPVARSGADDLYLSADAARAMDRPALPPALPPPLAFPEDLKPDLLAGPALAPFHPAPTSVRSRYGVVAGERDGRPVLNAHAPSELTFRLAERPTHISAVAGLAEGAYAPGATAVTDGITVEIIARAPDGRLHSLYQRHLDPARNESDRGPQRIELPLPADITGDLLFRFGNGPAGNPTSDWGYWQSIDIR
jgi:4-amino-4-deoxy-L-arabinose transferase-like glycosyltransferase